VSIQDKVAHVHYVRGRIHEELKEMEQARKAFEKAVELRTTPARWHDEREGRTRVQALSPARYFDHLRLIAQSRTKGQGKARHVPKEGLTQSAAAN
jgi:hypothetical protein